MDVRREQILAAASELAAERGMGAVSVRAVAARAGVGASTLRHYFPTQSELFQALVGRSFNNGLSDLNIADAKRPAAERLCTCMAQFLPADDGQVRELEGWLSLYASAFGPGRSAAGAQLLASLQKHANRRVRGWLAVLEAEGAALREDQDRNTMTLLAIVDGLCMDLLVGRSGSTVSEARGVLLNIVTRVIVAPSL